MISKNISDPTSIIELYFFLREVCEIKAKKSLGQNFGR